MHTLQRSLVDLIKSKIITSGVILTNHVSLTDFGLDFHTAEANVLGRYLAFLAIGPLGWIGLISNNFIAFKRGKADRHEVYENIKKTDLGLSDKEISFYVDESYTHFSDVFFEMIKLDNMNKKQISEKFILKNTDLINGYFKKNKSIILMASHYGGFEWCTTLDLSLIHI